MKNDHDADQFARKLSDLAERPPGYKYRQLKLNHDSIERALNNGWKIADYVAALNKETDMKISVPPSSCTYIECVKMPAWSNLENGSIHTRKQLL